MKLNRTHQFIGISSAALLIVLSIQVNWIFQTARIKEELFNEKANMVLSKTAAALSNDTITRRKMQICVGVDEVRKIDSLFNHYMKIYNIDIKYYFEVKPGAISAKQPANTTNISFLPNQSGCYQTCLDHVPDKKTGVAATNGSELKLIFPDKEEYIIEEMGVPFITSVILIVVVLVMFWQTILSLLKEKKISEHTTEFLNNMTHEFKTPLTNIALAGKMMVKEANINQQEKVKHYSGIILEENEKLRFQVDQVLSMTALERGEIPLRKAELDFRQLIHEALKCISVQIESRQGSIKFKLNAEHFIVLGDKTHLANVICNLVDNAIKYSREKPELVIETFNREEQLIIQVCDNGIGIEKEYHKEIFNKFFRIPTGDVHDVKGFGLGLAYSKAIIELHEGSIDLQSEKEKGTTFIITLPYA